jgi:hypothetical protein
VCRLLQQIPCPLCAEKGQLGAVTSDGWNRNGPRRVVDIHGHSYIWCKRYVCKSHERPYSFLGYDPEVVRLLPETIQLQFPVILTRKLAIMKGALHLTDTLVQHGLGFNTISKVLKELNNLRYCEKQTIYLADIKAHNELRRRKSAPAPRREADAPRPAYYLRQEVCPTASGQCGFAGPRVS